MSQVQWASTHRSQVDTSTSYSRKWLFVAVSPAALIYVYLLWTSSYVADGRRHWTLFDDAWISMNYARTLAESGELVWFPGADRVEGITNLAWTLFMALLHLAGLAGSTAALGVQIFGLLALLAAGISLGLFTKQLAPSSHWAPYAVAATSPLSLPAVRWTMEGMEVGFLVFLTCALLLLVATYMQRVSQSASSLSLLITGIGILAVLLIATRFDQLIVVGFVALWMVLSVPQSSTRLVAFASWSLLLTVTLGALFAWRWWYFGDVLPNTYYLKVYGYDALGRFVIGLVTTQGIAGVLGIGIAAGVALFTLQRGLPRRLAILVSGLMVIIAFYNAYVGGDAWEDGFANRFTAVVVVLAIALAYPAVELLIRLAVVPRWIVLFSITVVETGLILQARTQADISAAIEWLIISNSLVAVVIAAILVARRYRASGNTQVGLTAVSVFIAIFVTWTFLSSGSLWLERLNSQPSNASDRLRLLGEFVKEQTPGDASVAVVWAGELVYYSQRPAIDLLGKNDKFVARVPPRGLFWPGHNKWDYEHSVGRLRPDVILQTWSTSEADLSLFRASGYEISCIRFGDKEDHQIDIWTRENTRTLRLRSVQSECR